MAIVAYTNIEVDEKNVPYIAGTRTKVIEVVLDYLAYHWDAEEIHRQHPHLSLGQIHSALAYYFDHQAEMDHAIGEGLRRVDAYQATAGDSSIRVKLRTLTPPDIRNKVEYLPI